MAYPNDNQFQQVITYQMAELAIMQNSNCGIMLANKDFIEFQNKTGQLGDVVSFDLAPRAFAISGLIANPQPAQQRVQNLTCSQAANISYELTDQQFIFNVENYIKKFGDARIEELGGNIEADILKNFTSSVTVNGDPGLPNFGQIVDPTSGPYRFYGDGYTAIDSVSQLAQANSNFEDYGAAKLNRCAILPTTVISEIVNTAMNQFAPTRNDKYAQSWMLGNFGGVEYYKSNLLPIHEAGSVGNAGNPGDTLTLVSTNDPSGNNITQLTLSGASASDVNAIKNGDLAVFIDDVAGQPNLRYRTFTVHKVSSQPVQPRMTGDAASNVSGNVTVNIFPTLQSTPGANQNLSTSLRAGMKLKFLPSHRAGGLMSGNPLYLAMPKLPDQMPFPSVSTSDPETGASIRHYWGATLGSTKNMRMYCYDQIWGSTLVAENCMRYVFPL